MHTRGSGFIDLTSSQPLAYMYNFHGVAPPHKISTDWSLAKGTIELNMQSSFWAAPAEAFAVEPAHCGHTLQEVLNRTPWQSFTNTLTV